MPKINLDEDETLSGPIEFIIEGKTFKISKLTDKAFEKVSELTSVAEQFSFLTGTELSVVRELNLLKVAKAMKHVIQAIIGTMEITPEQLIVALPLKKEKKEDKAEKRKND